MKPETISNITVLLNRQAKEAEGSLMSAVRCDHPDKIVLERVAEYRKAIDTRDDFDEWVSEQEDT